MMVDVYQSYLWSLKETMEEGLFKIILKPIINSERSTVDGFKVI